MINIGMIENALTSAFFFLIKSVNIIFIKSVNIIFIEIRMILFCVRFIFLFVRVFVCSELFFVQC
eukprot:UN12751